MRFAARRPNLRPCRDRLGIWDYLGRTAPDTAISLQFWLDALVADVMPIELVIGQLRVDSRSRIASSRSSIGRCEMATRSASCC